MSQSPSGSRTTPDDDARRAEAPAGNDPGTKDTPAREPDRRSLLRTLTGIGLANVALSFLGGGAAAQSGGDGDDTVDCGTPNEDGSYSKDKNCNFPAGSPDKDCGKPDGNGNPNEDGRCGMPTPGHSWANRDDDCGLPLESPEEKFSKDNDCAYPNAPGFPVIHHDDSCGKPIVEPPGLMKDVTCGKPAGGGSEYRDDDCTVVIGGVTQKDDDCNHPIGVGGAVHQDNDCGVPIGGVTQTDQDCGKPSVFSDHKDDDCTLPIGGTIQSDEDCTTQAFGLGVQSDDDCTLAGPAGPYPDSDCGKPSPDGEDYPDGPN